MRLNYCRNIFIKKKKSDAVQMLSTPHTHTLLLFWPVGGATTHIVRFIRVLGRNASDEVFFLFSQMSQQ